MNLHDVLIKPVITEKSTIMTSENKYVFKIAKQANKKLVKEAVKELFGVEAARVNIQLIRSKKKRNRYTVGYQPAWKRAIVTLKAGDKIELYEQQ